MKKVSLLILYIIICFGYYTNAQLNTSGSGSNYYGETDATGSSTNWIRKIGIGNFSSNADEPHAFLHVSSRYLLLPANGSIAGTGEVLWTDCPTGTGTVDVSAWRMLRNGTQVFNISNPYGYSDIKLGTVQDGDLHLFTAGNSNTRITIMGHDNLPGATDNTGYVGIGTTSPNYNLEVKGVIAGQKFIIITQENTTEDLFATITQLQKEVNELKQQLLAMKN